MTTGNDETFDFIVVGSGAGGGPLAANLARDFSVLLLEAGSNFENDCYRVPGFHGLASEDPDLRWDYWVHHYDSREQRILDSKYSVNNDGVLYPRAGTLGGCTAHNAMITLEPHDSDWNAIADLTGDKSWAADRMHRYFARLERCSYVAAPGAPAKNILERVSRTVQWLTRFGGPAGNPSGHGYRGWLGTCLADPKLGLPDDELRRLLLRAVGASVARGIELEPVKLLAALVQGGLQHFDPNDLRERGSPEGICFTPLATSDGRRSGTREFILESRKQNPTRLTVRTNCLVTKVLLSTDLPARAIGVEYLEGANLYRADPKHGNGAAPVAHQVHVRHDVVVAAGAYNSPQLLKLSGIGPRDELEAHRIPVRVDLPGVGENLQDRYEVGVVFEMAQDFTLLSQVSFKPPDPGTPPEPAFEAWRRGEGIYTSNGAVLGIMLRSTRRAVDPDLFVFGLPGDFRGYYPGYSKDLLNRRNRFTWAVLKGHTENRGGQVRLRSADPRDTPEIRFRYFEEGTDAAGADLDSVVEGVLFARGIMKRAGGLVRQELEPGPGLTTREQLRSFIRNEAWGHHASCSNRMGPRSDPYAVVDSRFRVHGVRGLRVVDASVFPRIPGFFIVTPVYMISEKASDVLAQDAGAEVTPAAH